MAPRKQKEWYEKLMEKNLILQLLQKQKTF